MLRLPLVLLVGLVSLATSVAQAQTGLLVVAHGAGPEWNARVRETVAPMVLAPHAALAQWIERVAIARLETTP
jgi:hypothetical protein